jgi:hypothetical protein
MQEFSVIPPNPPNEGFLFVDYSRAGRSGHLGHALVEYEDGKILAFYPNCSNDNGGHSAIGWMEYRHSEDAGLTWDEPSVLPYSKHMLDAGQGCSAMCEKAVRSDSGDIVLFSLICDISENAYWRPYYVPTYLRSTDGGRTWSEAKALCDKRGRVYDAINHDGAIFALHFSNDATRDWKGTSDEHVYEMHVSLDEGHTFSKRSDLPFNTRGRGYGTMGVLESGAIIVFIYNVANERELDYVISDDDGQRWSEVKTAHFAKKIRNPQFISFNGRFFMHGRSGSFGAESGHLVLYSSRDGLGWDEGTYLRRQDAGHGAYSNSIVVGALNPAKPNRLLIQASHAYEKHKTNVLHWWIETPMSM